MTADTVVGDLPAPSSSPWSPLRVRIYRSLWIAGLVSNVGTFMHLVAAGWSVTTLSSSPVLAGAVQAAWAVPGFLLALHAGAFADVVDRRTVLLGTQAAALAVAGGLALAEALGAMSVPVLLVGTFLESVALTLAAPAFMALTPELVRADQLPQAIGLDSISRNAAQAVGPALAGGVIAAAGPGGVFALNAVSFVGVLAVVRRYRTDRVRPVEREFGAAIRAGVRHVASRRALRHPVVRLAAVTTAGSALSAMLPLVARGRLDVSPVGFGVLSAAFGIGSVAAVWVLPRLRPAQRPERTALVSAVVWSIGTGMFAGATAVWVGAVALLLAGAGTMGMLNVLFSNYTLQLDSWMRGRGSSLAMLMVWLGTSAGAIGWGVVGSVTSPATTLAIAAAANVAIAAGARVALPLTVAQQGRANRDALSP